MIKQKSQKPTDIDIHFKYICPKCDGTHWLSYNEVTTPKFQVVCDCGESFRIRRIDKIIYKYTSKSKTKKSIDIPVDIICKYRKVLSDFGVDPTEADTIVRETYLKYSQLDTKNFVKKLLEQIRG